MNEYLEEDTNEIYQILRSHRNECLPSALSCALVNPFLSIVLNGISFTNSNKIIHMSLLILI